MMADAWPLTKIISGGQSGADLAGVIAGKRLGYATGGKMPQGFLTENGYHPEYADLYGMEAIPHGSYDERTRANVLDSHGTLLFGDMGSSGSRLTLKFASLYHRPRLIVTDDEFVTGIYWDDVDACRRWIVKYKIAILNVAGNREGTHEGIGDRVVAFLMEALKR